MATVHRSRLPSPMVPRDYMSIWSILKNCIGKELSKITMPVVFNEPLTMLQRACEGIQYSYLLNMADLSDDPAERLEYICAFIVAGLSSNCCRIMKPFNPMLYETYEYEHQLDDGSKVRVISQQVSHHPPITAVCSESDSFVFNNSVNPRIKFWGRSIEIQPDGQCKVYLKRHNETYIFKSVSCSIHNIIVGKLWFEHSGPMDITCVETGAQANLVFKKAGWFSSDLHRFDGFIVTNNKKRRYIYGKWSDYIKSVDIVEYENFMRSAQLKVFRIPDGPDSNGANGSINHMNLSGNQETIRTTPDKKELIGASSSKRSPSLSPTKAGDGSVTQSTLMVDIPNSRLIWKTSNDYLEEYYSFTLFTMRLNELTPELEKSIAKTDSRFRLDVRKLEEGDLDGAANEKQRLEEKQRAARAVDKRFKNPSSDFLWFDLIEAPNTKEKFWIYRGGYWENKCNPEKFPDLF